jgi:hypothetical protein
MKRLAIVLALSAAVGCLTLRNETFRPRGIYNNAVHRFFPDLDRRENAIRYGRWRALEVSWREGVSEPVDRRFAEKLLVEMQKLPDFPPDPRLAAPALAREAPRCYDALRNADLLEREVADILAAGDATPMRNRERIDRALNLYRRQPAALSSPPAPPPPETERLSTFATARLLLMGDWLFARADEDLTTSDYGEQRWKIRETVERYDRELTVPPASLRTAWYEEFAPGFTKAFPFVSDTLDRATRFRIEIFAALASPDGGRRLRSVAEVERRYGLRK